MQLIFQISVFGVRHIKMKYAFDVDRLGEELLFIFGEIDEKKFGPGDSIQDARFQKVFAARIWEEDTGEWWSPKSDDNIGMGIIITINTNNTGSNKTEVFKRFLADLFAK